MSEAVTKVRPKSFGNRSVSGSNVRVRDYPITLDKLLAKLPEAA